MTLFTCLAVLAAAALPLVNGESTNPEVPRANDAALSFIDELVADLKNAAQGAEGNKKRGLSCTQESSITVNLGYAKYEGYHDEDTDLNVWKG